MKISKDIKKRAAALNKAMKKMPKNVPFSMVIPYDPESCDCDYGSANCTHFINETLKGQLK